MSWLTHKTFRHGIHPPDFKEDTRHIPIQQFPFAPVMVIPLAQHIGKPAIAIVNEGQEVLRGELIAKPDGFLSSAIHAPASGVIKRIDLVPTIKGNMVPGIYLKPFPASTQEVAHGTPCDLETASADDIISAIQNAGIVGLGGAAFPTHAKIKVPAGKTVDILVINGSECEPYLTTDHRVMLEQTHDIITGIRYVLKASGAQRAIIGVEANKQDAAWALRKAIPADLPISVEVLDAKYPQGAEKLLISTLLGRRIPSGAHAYDVHVTGINVATAAEIGRLLPLGRGIQERVITITGPAIRKKGNYRIPIGTPLRFALEYTGMDDDPGSVFLGGPMMGQAVANLDIPVTKGVSGITAFTQQHIRQHSAASGHSYPCIHCGRCVDACPMMLNPSRLYALANKQMYEPMTDELRLMDCFECGTCSYVCPSHIPLVQFFRLAKAATRKIRAA